MDEKKIAALTAAGWKVGTTEEFLDQKNEEAAFIEMKLALAEGLRALSKRKSLTQTEMAALMGSSQSREARA